MRNHYYLSFIISLWILHSPLHAAQKKLQHRSKQERLLEALKLGNVQKTARLAQKCNFIPANAWLRAAKSGKPSLFEILSTQGCPINDDPRWRKKLLQRALKSGGTLLLSYGFSIGIFRPSDLTTEMIPQQYSHTLSDIIEKENNVTEQHALKLNEHIHNQEVCVICCDEFTNNNEADTFYLRCCRGIVHRSCHEKWRMERKGRCERCSQPAISLNQLAFPILA